MKESYYNELSIKEQTEIFLAKTIPLSARNICEFSSNELGMLLIDCQRLFFDGLWSCCDLFFNAVTDLYDCCRSAKNLGSRIENLQFATTTLSNAFILSASAILSRIMRLTDMSLVHRFAKPMLVDEILEWLLKN